MNNLYSSIKNNNNFNIYCVIFLYYFFIFICSRNAPFGDDYYLLNFVNHTVSSNEYEKILSDLFSQHNEHRIVTTRIFFLLDYYLFGSINFIRLNLVGNLFQALTFYYIFKLFNINSLIIKDRSRKYLVTFTGIIFFSFSSAETALSTMASLSNYSVITLMVMCLYYSTLTGIINLIILIALLTIAVFTQGNGLVIPLIIALSFLFKKNYAKFLFIAMYSCLIISLYFYDYKTPKNHSDPLLVISHLSTILIFTISFVGNALGFAGSHYPLLTNFALCLTLPFGLLICYITFKLLLNIDMNNYNNLLWINVFVIATSLLTALSRYSFGLSQSMVPRYHMYSIIAIVSTILIISSNQKFAIQETPKISNYLMISAKLYYILTLFCLMYFYFIVYAPEKEKGYIHANYKESLEILNTAKILNTFRP